MHPSFFSFFNRGRNSTTVIVSGVLLAGWLVWRIVAGLSVDATGAVSLTPMSAWGDWPAHLIMTTRMRFGETLIPDQNPLLLGSTFSYPYAINLLSALLLKLQLPLFTAFILPHAVSAVLFVALLALAYRWFFRSNLTAGLALWIFFATGGLGFLHLETSPLLSFDQSQNLQWGALPYTLLIPQRSQMLGAVFGLFVLILGWKVIWNAGATRQRILNSGIVGLALLATSISHLHSALIVSGAVLYWIGLAAIWKWRGRQKLQSWFVGVMPMLIGALAALATLLMRVGQSTVQSSLSWNIGWYADTFSEWLQFWWNNWGVTPIMALVGLMLLVHSTKKLAIISTAIYFCALFLLANIVQLQPYIWDTTKVLFWAAIGMSGLAGFSIVKLLGWARQQSALKNRALATTAVLILLTSMVYAGTHDMVYLSSPQAGKPVLYTTEEVALANWVRANTPADSIWLTGDRHNHWVSNLTGRQVLITYPGWLWSHGLNYADQIESMRAVYQNPTSADIETWGLTYAVIGEYEQNSLMANKTLFAEHHSLIYETEHYTIYQLSRQQR